MHSDTHLFEAVRKNTRASIERTDFWRNSPKPHPSANASFQNYILSLTIKNPYWNKFNLPLRFSIFISEPAYDPYWEYVTETGIASTELILTFRWLKRASKAHPIQHSHDIHDVKWALCYFSYENLRYPLTSERCSYFSFSWRYWFGSHTWIRQSIDIPLVHHLEIFFWNGESTPLNTIN